MINHPYEKRRLRPGELAPGITLTPAPAARELDEHGKPIPESKGHIHNVRCHLDADPYESVLARFRVDARDGNIPAILAIKLRRAMVDLAHLAELLDDITPPHTWRNDSRETDDSDN